MKFTSKSKFRAIAVLFLALAVTVSCALWSVFGRRGNGEVSVSAVDSTEEITEAVKNAVNDFETITTVGLSAETVKMTTIAVSILPILILYPFLQKFYTKGVTTGAVKG